MERDAVTTITLRVKHLATPGILARHGIGVMGQEDAIQFLATRMPRHNHGSVDRFGSKRNKQVFDI
ncbi:hypothetical protein C6Q13_15090 [Burkholderia gladioli]|nr:hypothetical protein C6Q13_15090 [Burkholderia gladioli]